MKGKDVERGERTRKKRARAAELFRSSRIHARRLVELFRARLCTR